jgi:hypothetical protein
LNHPIIQHNQRQAASPLQPGPDLNSSPMVHKDNRFRKGKIPKPQTIKNFLGGGIFQFDFSLVVQRPMTGRKGETSNEANAINFSGCDCGWSDDFKHRISGQHGGSNLQ